MYFSVITPSVESIHRAAFSQLAHTNHGPYRDHQWLWRFFPAPEGSPRDFLFRRSEIDGLPRYYTVSARPPIQTDEGWDIQSRPYAPQLRAGQQLRFELRANPVVSQRVAVPGTSIKHKAVRHDVVMHAKRNWLIQRGLQRWSDPTEENKPELYELIYSACTQWLEQRSEKAGFTLSKEDLQVEGYVQHADMPHRRRSKRVESASNENSGSLSFSSVDFSGILTVTDPEQFQATLANGLGRAKAFGCGLMLVRRA